MYSVNQTHDPDLKSWLDSANDERTDFPIQNLPFCVFQDGDTPSIGVGIGDQVLNLRQVAAGGQLPSEYKDSVSKPTLNAVMALGMAQREKLRESLSGLLAAGTKANTEKLQAAMHLQATAKFRVPCTIRDYTDFYASLFHATNVGSMFRPNNPLLPNWKHIPIGYHGRASSVVIAGTEVRRPVGQKAPSVEGELPTRSPSKLLDYEMEVGFFVGRGNQLGKTISIEDAERHLFGLSLVNDWSARDLQKWEYVPLGPFLAKSFATTISPWIVTMEALAPFRCPAYARPDGDPQPLDYLTSDYNSEKGCIDIQLEVFLQTMTMRETGIEPEPLSRTTFKNMYWTIAQMLTHHSSNGCNLQPGDLMASGTVSGPDRSERGSMLELSWNGDAENPLPGTDRRNLIMPTGEERKFLADGDEVIFRGHCDDGKHRRIGFGECRGVVVPATE